MKKTTHEYADVISSLANLLAFIQKHCSEFDDIMFRGQTEDWPLLPKLARLRPRDDLTIKEAESKMLESLKIRSFPYLDRTPHNDWDWLAIAQHCGMATRLLDWSTNPLAALWFAVEKPARIGNPDGVVWIFTPSQTDHVENHDSVSPFESKRTRVFRPKHINRKIVAQHGWFTAHYINEQSYFVPLENNYRYKKSLTKLRIPAKQFPEIRVELDRCGINAATLYGNLEGLCRDSEWQYSLLEDEDG